MNIFDILGPIMVGPSSSHTAGAVKIGKVARTLLGGEPKHAWITLHGSFAATGSGHGTDKALIAGLLGMNPDDMRIPDSEIIAEKRGLEFHFSTKHIREAHPNTALIQVDDGRERQVNLRASSIGGGRIRINEIDGIPVDFSAESPTLIVNNEDRPGHVAAVTSILAEADINIATLTLNRGKRGGKAIFVTETDLEIPASVVEKISQIPGVLKVTYLNAK